jgi:hypothetical protein
MKNLYSIALFLLSVVSFAQTKLEVALKSLDENFEQEKVYLLFDKENYIAGDNIWFKAYVMNGYKPTDISTNLFVEIYDKNKKLLDRKLVPIIDGQSDGTLTMKADIPEGEYFVRAYTTYMDFFPIEFQHIDPIKIYNPTSKLKLVPKTDIKWKAEAFVEGGNLIENQTTKIAVRLKSSATLPKKWNGFVIEKDHPENKVATFDNLDENVASFYLKAEADKNYQAVISDAKGNQQTIDLPQVQKSGVLLKITSNDKGAAYQLKSINLPKQLLNHKIIGTINNEIIFSSGIVKEISTYTNILTKDVIGKHNGILNISVLDENDSPVANRLYFIDQGNLSKKPQIVYETNKNPREINTIKVQNTDPALYTSVIRDNTNLDQDNFLSAVWLTRDFSSTISNPSQYFTDKKNTEALDALLISEKWKRYSWDELLNKAARNKIPRDKYLSYKGKVIANGGPLSDSSLGIMYKTQDSEKDFITVETYYDGSFEMNNMFYYGPMAMNYFLSSQNNNSNNVKGLVLSMVPMFKTSNYRADFPESNYELKEVKDETIVADVKKQEKYNNNQKIINNKSIRLKEVVVKAEKQTKTEKLNDELSSGMFKSMNEKVIDFVNGNENVQGYSNIIDYLASKIAGLTVSRGQSGESIPMIRNSAATIYYNEMKVSSDMISSINVNDIAMVKVFKGAGILGDAIAIYSKRGSDRAAAPADNMMLPNNLIQLGGYNKALPYFSNDDYESLYNDVPDDIRTVMYWNTQLRTDDNNEAVIEYFNNDTPKNYSITLIGYDENGQPLFYEGKIN